jgi:hypothetical protein
VKRNKLLNLLVAKMGEEEMEFIIPYLLLPPRYRKLCQNRNLIVTLGIENTIQLRWENVRLTTWMSPTPGEFRTIVSYALRKLQEYRRDLQTFGNFVDRVAEPPFQDPIFDDGEASTARVAGKKEAVSTEAATIGLFPFIGGGGESPNPTWMMF